MATYARWLREDGRRRHSPNGERDERHEPGHVRQGVHAEPSGVPTEAEVDDRGSERGEPFEAEVPLGGQRHEEGAEHRVEGVDHEDEGVEAPEAQTEEPVGDEGQEQGRVEDRVLWLGHRVAPEHPVLADERCEGVDERELVEQVGEVVQRGQVVAVEEQLRVRSDGEEPPVRDQEHDEECDRDREVAPDRARASRSFTTRTLQSGADETRAPQPPAPSPRGRRRRSAHPGRPVDRDRTSLPDRRDRRDRRRRGRRPPSS